MKKIPVIPAPPPGVADDIGGTNLNDPNFLRTVLAIMLVKTFGVWSFSQEDFDNVAGKIVMEGRDPLGRYCLGVMEKPGTIQ